MIYRKNDKIGQYQVIASYNDKVLLVQNNATKEKEYIQIIDCDVNYNTTPKVFPRIVEAFEEHGKVFLVQESLKGENFAEILKRSGFVDVELAVNWTKDLCRELEFMAKINQGNGYGKVTIYNTILTPDHQMKFVDAYRYGEQLNVKESLTCIGKWLNKLLCGHTEVFPIRTIDPVFSHTLQEILERCIRGEFDSFDALYQALNSYESVDKIVYAENKMFRPKRRKQALARNDLSDFFVCNDFYELKEFLWKENDHQEDVLKDIMTPDEENLFEEPQSDGNKESAEEENQKEKSEEFHSENESETLEQIDPTDQVLEQTEKSVEIVSPILQKETQKEAIVMEDDSKKISIKSKTRYRQKLGFIIPITILFLSIVGWKIHLFQKDREYTDCLQISARTTNKRDQIRECKKAIRIYPGKTEAYEQLLSIYSEDAIFTLEEEKEFLAQIHDHWNDIKENQDYGALAYQIGRTYWYYYNYGTDTDNEITRMKSAAQWFEDSLEYKDIKEYHAIAKTYCEIGKFNKNIVLNVESGEDQGMYKKYFNNLEQLLRMEQANDITKLELYKLIVSSLNTYKNNFIADGITEEEVTQMRQTALSQTENIYPSTQRATDLKNEILAQK